MFRKNAIRICAALLLAVPSIYATDITGKWFGTIQSYDRDEETPDPVRFEFRQIGDRTVGLRIDIHGRIDLLHNIELSGSRVTFERGDERFLEEFELSLDGDTLRGRLLHRTGDEAIHRNVTLTRGTSPDGPFTGVWKENPTRSDGTKTQYRYIYFLDQNGAAVQAAILITGVRPVNLPRYAGIT